MPSLSQSKRVRALRRSKERRASGEFLVEGPRVLGELLRAELPVTLVLYTEAAVAEPAGRRLLELVARSGAPAEQVSEEELRRHADTVSPQGWIATAPQPGWDLGQVAASRVLALDGIGDPGNVGTLVRAAEAMDMTAVVTLPGTADPWSPKVVRAAAGSSLRVPVLEVDPAVLLRWLREEGADVWVAAADGEPVGRSAPAPDRVALVLGNETSGVSAAMREAADRAVAIPMKGAVESLNAAVAGAILMDRLFGG
ncbi:MAG: RNA methyltransferase [marine benthic group bacterium]|jgi:TrmH family RNA methyltransferase|nr:RNA methyltransferase [Candidatus Benthicola marisminoris]